MDMLYDTDAYPREHVPQPLKERRTVPNTWLSILNTKPENVPRKPVEKHEGYHPASHPDPTLEITPRKCPVKSKRDSAVNTFISMIDRNGPVDTARSRRIPTFARSQVKATKSKKTSTVTSTLTSSVEPGSSVQWSVLDHTTGKKLLNKEQRKRVRTQKLPTVEKEETKILPTAIAEDNSHMNKPEFNSALKLASELMKLNFEGKSEGKNDIEKKLPEEIKTKILEKAAAQVNIPVKAKLYENLISIDKTPEGSIIHRQDKPSKSRAAFPTRAKDPEPNILDCRSDFKTSEYYHLDLDLPPLTLSKKEIVPKDHAFLQYRLTRMWEGLS